MTKIVFLIVGTLIGSCTGIPKHSYFKYENATGLIKLQEKEEEGFRLNVRLNLKGSGAFEEQGAPLILWPCGPADHEQFKFEDGLIKLKANEQLCLNVEGGAGAGRLLNLYPCEHDGNRVPHEEFDMRSDGRISLKQEPNVCLNVKGGSITYGAEITTWPCGTFAENEVFHFSKDGMISAKEKPDFHFNIQGDLTAGSRVWLWSCEVGPHEAFEFTTDARIRMKMKNEYCLNAEGGVAQGHRIIVWPCSEEPQPNELFKYEGNTIFSVTNPELGFNVAGGGMNPGDEIVLWTLSEESEDDSEEL